MPRYRMHYLKDSALRAFRESPPSDKPYTLRMRDYEARGEIEASSPYTAWKLLQREEPHPQYPRKFGVGDVLETESSELLLLNFWGFDSAQWRSGGEQGREQDGTIRQTARNPAPVP